MRKVSLCIVLLGVLVHYLPAQIITTLVGNVSASNGLKARDTPLVSCRAVAADPDGTIYIADDGSRTVRRIDPVTRIATVIAGGGPLVDDLVPVSATQAYLNLPVSLAVGPGKSIFIADDANRRIRRVDANGLITTVAGNGTPGPLEDGAPAIWAHLASPGGVAVDASGNIYIADTAAGAIRKVEAGTRLIRTIAGGPAATGTGDGIPAKDAAVQLPTGIAVDASGNVFFAESGRFVVRKIEAASGLIRTVAGNGTPGSSGDGGPATAANLFFPTAVAVASNGDLFIGHQDRVRKVSAANGAISTVLGGGGAGLAEGRAGAEVGLRSGAIGQLSATLANVLLVALPDHNLIVQLNLSSGIISLVAGDSLLVGDGGPAKAAALAVPSKLALDTAGNLYIADTGHHRVRRVAPGAGGVGTGPISTVAGTGVGDTVRDGVAATATPILSPRALAIDSGNNLYFTDGPALVRRVGVDGILRTAAGTGTVGASGDGGPATAAQLGGPTALALDASKNLYIAETGSNRVRKVDNSGVIRTISGSGVAGYSGDGGPGTAAQLDTPLDLLLDANGGLLIADMGNRRVRRLDLATGKIATVAGNGTFIYAGDGGPATLAGIPGLSGLAMDSRGNLYVSVLGAVRRIDAATQTITTVAGSFDTGFSGDDGLAVLARLRGTQGMVVDSAANLIVADTSNHRVRRVFGTPVTAELAVSPSSLKFSAVAGGEPPPPQMMQILTRNQATASWTASVRLDNGSGWLITGPPAGLTPAVLPVGVNPAGLAPDTYTATITISAAAATNSPQPIKVTLTVTAGGKPQLTVDRQSLTFRATSGGSNPSAQTVALTNAGGGQLRWSSIVQTRGGLNWLSVSPDSGEGSASVVVSAALGTLASGVYQGLVAFINVAGGEIIEIPATFIVSQSSASLMLSHLGTLFIVNEGASYVPPDTVQVVNAGQGDMSWNTEISPLSGGDWLALSPTSGKTASGSATALTLTARPAGLAAGVYSTLVRVLAADAINSPQLVLAQLAVQPAGTSPMGAIRPGGIALVTAAGGGVQQGSLSISTSGGTTLSYVAAAGTSDGAAWLSVSPSAGSLQGSADGATLTVQANPAKLAAGVYRGRVTVSFNTANNAVTQDVGVLLVVTPAGSSAGIGSYGSGRAEATGCTASQQYPLHTALLNNFSLPSSWATPVLVRVLDNCGDAVSNSAVAATFSNGDEALLLRPIGNGLYSGMWNPGRSGATSITVLATGSGLQAGKTEPISGVVGTAGVGGARAPLIYRNGAVSGASFKRYAPLAPGQIFSLFGNNLATDRSNASAIPLPRSLGGVTATLGGVDLPLYYADGGQVNAQVPFDLPPGNTLPLLIKSGSSASPPELVTLANVQPGIFTVDSSGSGAGVVTDAQGTPIGASNPAHAGQVVIVYATGLGATSPAVRSGEASPGDPPARVTQAVSANVGGAAATVEFAGLTPGLVGLYQVNVRIPDNAQPGDSVELYLEQNQVASNKVTLVIR